MLVRFEKSKIEIDEIPTINGHKIILRYSLPCSYAFYNTIKRDNAVLMKCTQRIDYHKLV